MVEPALLGDSRQQRVAAAGVLRNQSSSRCAGRAARRRAGARGRPCPSGTRRSRPAGTGTPRIARGLGLAADFGDLADPLGRVGGRDRGVGIEVDALGRPADLRVGRDVLALAEERLVERVLERPQPPLVACPQAGGQDQRRARLVARQVDLDRPARARAGRRAASSRRAGGRRAARAAPSAPAAARTAATRPRPRPRPRPPRPRATPCTSTGRRCRSRNGSSAQ